ncbi:uncharacterized protein LOC124691840 isoform X1 [Lolium rigidum]|uniref:uncharacterized protein LOC124691840 isoform X1 n=1 Tax=Lolium rigidum TaxID=89674 RepID=UPI001F5D10AF|nr:uncharacterized protein LOC124691840 isoform X1 [Lolium rigidum]
MCQSPCPRSEHVCQDELVSSATKMLFIGRRPILEQFAVLLVCCPAAAGQVRSTSVVPSSLNCHRLTKILNNSIGTHKFFMTARKQLQDSDTYGLVKKVNYRKGDIIMALRILMVWTEFSRGGRIVVIIPVIK